MPQADGHGDQPSPGALEPKLLRLTTHNAKMRMVLESARRAATMDIPVLLLGETGTGKEVFARGLHELSGRPGRFVPVNCGAVPVQLFEAELFGARRGAYTGLDGDRPGLIPYADGGTLFLDEIGELPPPAQAKLLRVLQDGEVWPLGETAPIRVHVRLVAATNRDLRQLVTEQQFRDDLYYRLGNFPLRLPPLRERLEDLPLLVDEIVGEIARARGIEQPVVEAAALELLSTYHWPGNIRELMHAAMAAMVNLDGSVLRRAHFRVIEERRRAQSSDLPSFVEALTRFEERYISELWLAARGNIAEAARISGLSRTAVRAKLQLYGLRPGAQPKTMKRLRARRS